MFLVDMIAVARSVDPGLFFPDGPLDTDDTGSLTWDTDRYGAAPEGGLTEWMCA